VEMDKGIGYGKNIFPYLDTPKQCLLAKEEVQIAKVLQRFSIANGQKKTICRWQFFANSTFARVNEYHFCSSSLKNNGLKAGSIKLAHQFEAATQFKKHR
jgi:hypothetical protein